ncbi:MAG: hypothetical protein ACYC3X_13090 [Pirellulaceae bacterium]
MKKIVEGVEGTAAKISEIAAATVQQSGNAEESSRAVQSIALVTEQSAAGSEEMASSSEQLGAQAQALRELGKRTPGRCLWRSRWRAQVPGRGGNRQWRGGLRPQGADPFFASLAQKLHVKRTTELQIARADGQSFTDSSARVIDDNWDFFLRLLLARVGAHMRVQARIRVYGGRWERIEKRKSQEQRHFLSRAFITWTSGSNICRRSAETGNTESKANRAERRIAFRQDACRR